jgi:AcrR family transcriptional regulator
MVRKATEDTIKWVTGDGSEEETVLARVPGSRRLRQILQDLELIVHEEGFLHLGMSDIAAKLRCSNVTLYRLAEGRSELFALLVELLLARARDSGRAAFDAATNWPDRLTGYLGAGAEVVRKTSFAFIRDLQAFPGGRRALFEHQERRVADLEQIVAAGVKAGAFNDVNPEVAADILFHSMRRFIEPEFLAKVRLNLSEAMDEVYKLIEYGIIRTAAAEKSNAARRRRQAK